MPGHLQRPRLRNPRSTGTRGADLGVAAGTGPARAPDDRAAQRRRSSRCSSRWSAMHQELYPKADLALAAARLRRRGGTAPQPDRKSGDPYITHPLAVANILAELGMDTTTLVAALLHDTVEDTGYSLEQLDRGVRRGGRPSRRRRHQARQGGARQRGRSRDHPQDDHRDGPRPAGAGDQGRRPAAQHAHHAVPAAGEAGPQGQGDPRGHRAAGASAGYGHGQVGARGPGVRDPAPEEVRRDRAAGRRPGAVAGHLPGARCAPRSSTTSPAPGSPPTVEGRPKHYWSIYQKMIVKGRDFDDIHDLVGVRILCDEIRDCYAAVGVVHSLWQPMAGPVQGLHRSAPLRGVPVAAHHGGRSGGQAAGGADPHPGHAPHRGVRHRRALAVQGDQGQAHPGRRRRGRRHGVDAPAARLAAGGRRPGRVPRVAALRPGGQGDLRLHPQGRRDDAAAGSTPVDFAYAVHTEVGHRCIGARVNGRLVALERKLENGEVVEVFTSKAANAGPSRDWQASSSRPRAKAKIRQWFAKERREEALEAGKDAIAKEVRRGRPADAASAHRRLDGGHRARTALRRRSALYTAVGEDHVSAQHVVQRLVAHLGGIERRRGGARRAVDAVDDADAPRAPVTRACWFPGRRAGASWPSAAPRCRATRSWAS